MRWRYIVAPVNQGQASQRRSCKVVSRLGKCCLTPGTVVITQWPRVPGVKFPNATSARSGQCVVTMETRCFSLISPSCPQILTYPWFMNTMEVELGIQQVTEYLAYSLTYTIHYVQKHAYLIFFFFRKSTSHFLYFLLWVRVCCQLEFSEPLLPIFQFHYCVNGVHRDPSDTGWWKTFCVEIPDSNYDSTSRRRSQSQFLSRCQTPQLDENLQDERPAGREECWRRAARRELV